VPDFVACAFGLCWSRGRHKEGTPNDEATAVQVVASYDGFQMFCGCKAAGICDKNPQRLTTGLLKANPPPVLAPTCGRSRRLPKRRGSVISFRQNLGCFSNGEMGTRSKHLLPAF
jgi:hypothetical protein